jgi:hypothetical protein
LLVTNDSDLPASANCLRNHASAPAKFAMRQ